MILYGLAGSGKTTQAKLLLQSSPEFEYVGSSDSIRARATREPAFAEHARAMMAAGELVDEHELMTCVKQRIDQIPSGKQLIVDGVTRTKYQAEEMVRLLQARDQAKIITFHFTVPEAVALERMRKQQEDEKRTDGSDTAMTGRLDQYREHSAAILRALEDLTTLIHINGDQPPEKVFADIKSYL